MEPWQKNLKIIRNLLFIKFLFLSLYILYSLSNIFIPLVFAFFLAIFLQPLVSWLLKKKIPFGLSVVLITVGFFSILFAADLIVYSAAKDIIAQRAEFSDRINLGMFTLLQQLSSSTPIDVEVSDLSDSVHSLLNYNWLLQHSGSVANKIGNFSGSFFITILYFVGMLGGITHYRDRVRNQGEVIKANNQDASFDSAFERIQKTIRTYIKVKTFTSFLTGLGYALVCYFFGVDYYLLWGFLAFSLNFIPAIGSIVSTIPPTIMGIMFFDNFSLLLLFVLLLIGIQIVVGSILDPILMGSRLSLNIVTVILGIVFWGYLWGIPGMILSVPMMVLFKLILEQLPDAEFAVSLMEAKDKEIKGDDLLEPVENTY